MTKKIMVVEDETAIAEMIAMNLRAAGMEPTIFNDGESASRSLRTFHGYDLALLDIMLPKKDGFALFSDIKPYGVPVIFLTAKDDLTSKITGLQGGAEDYIVKPFEVLELLVRIEKVLKRNEKRTNLVQICGLQIDLSARAVRRGETEIQLKPMEFDLLAVLAARPNVAISREELLQLVWGANYLGETRTVDVHIAQLRKKLDLFDAIVTVPKYGYRLEVRGDTA